MKKIRIISDYVNNISFDNKSPLDFLIEDNIAVNPYHKYIVKKIISQLQVGDHIQFFGPAIKTNQVTEILRANST